MSAVPSERSARVARALPAPGAGLATMALIVLAAIAGAALLAPILAPHDPGRIAPAMRLHPPGPEFWLGTDDYGRDLLSRILYGGRVSLLIGLGAAGLAMAAGLLLGLLAGYFDRLGAVLMRVMDGIMAIPNVLLAVAVVALWGGSPATVLVAVVVPEIPRVTRLVRALVLSGREEPFVEAARALATSPARILARHLMPQTFGPLFVQGAYVCASAILLESMLSFLGVGINPEIPTWGNIMADGRLYLQLRPGMILWPGLLLSLTILSINILGDSARDRLDPRLARPRSGP